MSSNIYQTNRGSYLEVIAWDVIEGITQVDIFYDLKKSGYCSHQLTDSARLKRRIKLGILKPVTVKN